MAAPSHLHLLGYPQTQTLALAPPSSRGLSAAAGELLGRVEAFLYTVAEAQVEGMQAQILAAFIMRKKLKDPRGKVWVPLQAKQSRALSAPESSESLRVFDCTALPALLLV